MRNQYHLIVGLTGFLSLVLVLAISVSVSQVVEPEAISRQTIDPCAHLARVRRTQGYFERADWSVASFVEGANTVAKVQIQSIDAARFDTPAGAPPTPLPTQATEEEREDYNDSIYSATVLQAVTIYSGTQVTGYVVPKWGGATTACPNYVYESLPQLVQGNVGDHAMVVLYEQSYLTNPPQWFQYLEAYAAQLSIPPNVAYRVMMPYTWYRYVGSDAINSIRIVLNMPISQLESEVDAATP